jgi:hypothetical protein
MLWRGNTIELPRKGVILIGRSARCDIVIEDSCVSRTHCRLEVAQSGVSVEDLRSSNGLYVNGDRVVGSQPLANGDRLLVGSEELVMYARGMSAPAAEPSAALLTPVNVESALDGPAAWRRQRTRSDPQIITTQKADAFETLGRLADRMLATGRVDAAAKILSGHMKSVLGGVREGATLPEEVVAGSTRYAMKLAEARQEGSWIDYVLELHLGMRQPLPRDLAGQIQALFDRGVTPDRDLLLMYKQSIRTAVLEGALWDRALVDATLAVEPLIR